MKHAITSLKHIAKGHNMKHTLATLVQAADYDAAVEDVKKKLVEEVDEQLDRLIAGMDKIIDSYSIKDRNQFYQTAMEHLVEKIKRG